MALPTDTIGAFSALIDQCVKTLEASNLELGMATAAKLKEIAPLANELEVQRPELPFANTLGAIEGNPFQPLITEIMPYFPWRLRDSGDWTLFTPNAPVDQAAYSWIELVGPEGIASADDFAMGFWWQDAGIHYPMHRHNAEEFYYIISGSAKWYCESAGERTRGPGDSFVHSSLEDHATTTQAEPVLAMWAWRGDLTSDSYSKDPV